VAGSFFFELEKPLDTIITSLVELSPFYSFHAGTNTFIH
jgi:hypothetical protein